MSIKPWYLVGITLCFLTGAYVWKVTHTSVKPIEPLSGGGDTASSRATILVYVGEEPITSEDLDFEYTLHTKGIFDAKDLTPVPKIESYEKQLTPLKEKLVAGMIERKLLFLFVNQDRSFTLDDPSRFTSCLAEWQSTIKEAGEKTFSDADGERLKERLCERSIIEQYLKEKVYQQVSIGETDVKKYYQEHKKDFIKPKRVLIRQIVLESEEAAKTLMPTLNRANFGQKAKEHSVALEAQKGGLVGPFAQGEMPRFFDLAFSMAKGEIYGVLKSPYGFHIIMLEETYSKTEQTLEQARVSIKAALQKTREQEEYKKWLEVAINAVPVKTPGSKI